ncbi:hypothetical protein [Bartonella sp. B30(2025)]
MLIQSLLFFILGVASISWLLVLFSPLIWRRAVYFAHKFISAQIPSSVTEMKANYDFLLAQHAVERVRNEQKYDSLQEKYAQQKIQLSQTTEQLYRLCFHTQYTASFPHKKESTTIKNAQDAHIKNNFITEIKTMREKITHYLQRLEKNLQHLEKIQNNESENSATPQIMDELREETKELAATLAAQVALQEGPSSPINTLIQNSKSKNDLASCIRQKIAHTSKASTT